MSFKVRVLNALYSAKVLKIIFPRAKSQTLGIWRQNKTKWKNKPHYSYLLWPLHLYLFVLSLFLCPQEYWKWSCLLKYLESDIFYCLVSRGPRVGLLDGFSCRIVVLTWQFQTNLNGGFLQSDCTIPCNWNRVNKTTAQKLNGKGKSRFSSEEEFSVQACHL